MSIIKSILLLTISMVQIGFGQIENDIKEKVITTINFWEDGTDTIINIIEFEPNEDRLAIIAQYISNPSKIDTIRTTKNEKVIEYSWADKSKSYAKEINTLNQQIKIGFDKNGIDTIFYSRFNIGKSGLPTEGTIVNNGNISRYIINEHYSLDEIWKIQTNILRESEFICFQGIIEAKSRGCITITNFEKEKNSIKIYLNRNLKPKKIFKQQWHEYHKVFFETKYIYKYKSNNLIELRGIDMYGDLEMIRTLQYR